jgi:hypothetical protein
MSAFVRLVMKVRIRRVPPSHVLEGVDLRPYNFEEGRAYDVDPEVAKVLILWDYAELEHVHAEPKPEQQELSRMDTCPSCQARKILRARGEGGDVFYCLHCDHIWPEAFPA